MVGGEPFDVVYRYHEEGGASKVDLSTNAGNQDIGKT